MTPLFVLVESNTTGTGLLFVEEATNLGFTPLVITATPDRYSYLRHGKAAHLVADTADESKLRAVILELGRRHPIAGVYSSSEYFLATAAALARSFQLFGEDPETLTACRNKYSQRLAFRSVGLATPDFFRIRCGKDLLEALATIPLPLVLKPTQGTGSEGVRLCRTKSEAESHANLLLSATTNQRGLRQQPELVAESLLDGQEYSAEMFGGELIGITRKYLSPEPYFIELGHDHPAGLPLADNAAVERMCRTALAALGLGWGPSHIEFRWTSDGPVIVEVNARLAGGFIPELVRRATGINLIRQTIARATGMRPNLVPSTTGFASIRFLTYPRNGRLDEIDVSRVAELPGVEAGAYGVPGQVIEIHHDFRDRAGHVIAAGTCPDQVAQLANAGAQRLIVRMHGSAG